MSLCLSFSAVVFASLSAIFWFLSSRVKFKFGFDMDEHLNKTMVKASKLNSWAATFTALAVLSQAISMFIEAYSKVNA